MKETHIEVEVMAAKADDMRKRMKKGARGKQGRREGGSLKIRVDKILKDLILVEMVERSLTEISHTGTTQDWLSMVKSMFMVVIIRMRTSPTENGGSVFVHLHRFLVPL
jgi:hypothetical protein